MIIVIDALNRNRFADLVDEMFQLRARVFAGRLGWEVEVSNGREIDRFDALDPAYVIGVDDDGHVISCVRALQTTGPHMLSEVFHGILDGEPPLRSVHLWESTRFCVDTARLCGNGGTMKAVSRATCELMIGSLEYARASGIKDIVTVIDPVVDRVLKRSDNAPYGYVGSTKQMGKVPAMAALLDCTEDRISRVRAFSGIGHDVFVSDDDMRRLLDRRKQQAADAQPMHATADAMRAYCRDQLMAATTEEDRAAALRLFRELIEAGICPSTPALVHSR